MYMQEEDYVHRIGRVGRAETMGLAVSLVSAHKEKVPDHYVKLAESLCKNRRMTLSNSPSGYVKFAEWLCEIRRMCMA